MMSFLLMCITNKHVPIVGQGHLCSIIMLHLYGYVVTHVTFVQKGSPN